MVQPLLVTMKHTAVHGMLLIGALVVIMRVCRNVRNAPIFDSIYSDTRLLVRTLVVTIVKPYGKDSDNVLRRLCPYQLGFTFIRRTQLINVS